MKNKQIIRAIIQSFLSIITIFIILEFYQHDMIPYMVKWATTISLVVANCIFGHWCGLRNGVEMIDSRKRSFGK